MGRSLRSRGKMIRRHRVRELEDILLAGDEIRMWPSSQHDSKPD